MAIFDEMSESPRLLERPPRRAEAEAPEIRRTRVKISSLGDSGVGKSCLIKRYCEERFVSKYMTTIGVDYGVSTWVVSPIQPCLAGLVHLRADLQPLAAHADVLAPLLRDGCYRRRLSQDNLEVKVNFFDTSGSDLYAEVRREFLEGVHGVMLVFDVTSRASFDHLEGWLEELALGSAAANSSAPSLVVHVCGNMVSLHGNGSLPGRFTSITRLQRHFWIMFPCVIG